jgi:hypothetical protein
MHQTCQGKSYDFLEHAVAALARRPRYAERLARHVEARYRAIQQVDILADGDGDSDGDGDGGCAADGAPASDSASSDDDDGGGDPDSDPALRADRTVSGVSA